MINTNRIVPVVKTDLLTLYGTILKIANVSVTALAATDTDGNFEQSTNNATVICTEPVKSFNFTSTAVGGKVYFVPANNFEGFKNGTTPIYINGTVDADGATLYTATFSSGVITYAKVGF